VSSKVATRVLKKVLSMARQRAVLMAEERAEDLEDKLGDKWAFQSAVWKAENLDNKTVVMKVVEKVAPLAEKLAGEKGLCLAEWTAWRQE
jgi:hypothetical protein